MSTLSSVLKVISEIAAPTAVVTALLVYVGWTRNRTYYGYFGINQGILNPSVQDYVLRSTDVTFGAVARLSAAAMAFAILDRLLLYLIGKSPDRTWVTWINVGLAATGLCLAIAGLLSAVDETGLGMSPLVAATVLAFGAVLTLRFGPAALSRFTDIEPFGRLSNFMVYTALALALFWAATLYAQDLGMRAARSTDNHPDTLPLVTVFSADYLDLPGSLVQATAAPGPGGSQHYRYSGLSLLTYSNGRWFLITGRYSNGYRSSIVVLQDSGSVRVEVAANR